MKSTWDLMTHDDAVTRMIELSEKEYNCSQIIMALFLEQEKIENPDLLRAMSGLAHGCGSFTETCGIMTGAASVVAFYGGKGADNESESDNMLPMLEELSDWFRQETSKRFNGTRCQDIAGDLVGTPEVQQICSDLIIHTYDKIKEILIEYNENQ